MARVGFIMSVGSHQNATFGFAKSLIKKGHEVVYAGTERGIYDENLRENVLQQGFQYFILDPYQNSDDASPPDYKQQFLRYAENILDGRIFADFVSESKVDIILLDIHLPIYAIAFYPFDVEVIFLSTELCTDRNDSIPPLNSWFIPSFNEKDSEQILDLWNQNSSQNQLNKFLKALVDELSRMHEFPLEQLFIEKCIVLFGLKYPEILLWHPGFEFQLVLSSNRHYVGLFVDLQRKEADFDWSIIRSDQPIIYCAFGTVLKQEGLQGFKEKIFEVVQRLTQFTFIFSLGRLHSEQDVIKTLPNLYLFKSVPQIGVLRRSRLMITLAGANSIKECIVLGVPMLCYPFHNDQFGNSARVVFHELGLRGEIVNDSSTDIQYKIEDLMKSHSYQQNIHAFRSKIQHHEEEFDLNDIGRWKKTLFF